MVHLNRLWLINICVHAVNWTDMCSLNNKEFKPTGSRVATELLDLGPRAPLPACNSVVEGAGDQLLLVELHGGAGVRLDAVDALAGTHVPQLGGEVVRP